MRVVGSTEIRVISPIDATNDGPTVPKGRKDWQPVHLRQGTMDGACGLYSLMMGLTICGVIRHEDARNFLNFSSKTKIGKLFEYFGKSGPLVKNGTTSSQICTAIDDFFKGEIRFERPKSDVHDLLDFIENDLQGKNSYKRPQRDGQDLTNFIDNHVKKNHPVLLMVDYEIAAHWVLVIGRECERQGQRTTLCRFLVLDPSEATPHTCSWNGVIDIRKQKSEYHYRWWSSCERNIKLVDAIALSRSNTNNQ